MTKSRLVMAMLERALSAKVTFRWFTANEAYSQVKYLRVWLEQHDIVQGLATRRNDTLVTGMFTEARGDELVAALPARAWQRIADGAHGPRDTICARAPICIGWEPAVGTGCWHDAR